MTVDIYARNEAIQLTWVQVHRAPNDENRPTRAIIATVGKD